uniref:Uncharacterized protein n=1 Tax=Aegilops tauschii subsp. strangulata TaxID=200361 RepID=A0A453N4H0_AEGTS
MPCVVFHFRPKKIPHAQSNGGLWQEGRYFTSVNPLCIFSMSITSASMSPLIT